MNLTATFRHMPEATGPCNKRSKFRSTPGKIYSALATEIRRLNGRGTVIEAGFREDQIRNDGWPYSSARPSHSAVRVSFQSDLGPLSFDCSTYTTIDDNLLAIAKTMERLRDIARYGAVKGGQQYQGWKQLPGEAPPDGTKHLREVDEAARYLCHWAGEPEWNRHAVASLSDALRRVYRVAAAKAHPDAGGSHAHMTKVNAARDLIEKHQGAAR